MSKHQGHISHFSSVTQCVRVKQDRPTDKKWKLWQKANLPWSNAQGNLKQPLGSWLKTSQLEQRQWHFAYRFGSRLAIRMGTAYHIYKNRHGQYHSTGVIVPFEDLPTNAHATDVKYDITTDTWSPQIHQCGPLVNPPFVPVSATFDQYVQSLDAWEIDLLFHTKMSMDPYSVCDTLAHGIGAVSDGSVRYNTQGSFGWVLSAQDGERVATGKGPARGPRPTPFRAEGYALLSVLLFLNRVKAFTSMHDSWIEVIATDSKSLLQTLRGNKKTPNPHRPGEPIQTDCATVTFDVLRPDWDVLIEIQYAMSQLPEVTLQFIRGHQDKNRAFASLPLLAQLNVEADDMASSYQNTHGGERPFILMSPRTRAHLVTKQGTVTAQYSSMLHMAYTGPGCSPETYPAMQCMVGRNNGKHQLDVPRKGVEKSPPIASSFF